MASDTRIQDVKALLDSINADDVAEDAAFQAQIDSLSTSNAALVAERDALLAEKTATIADLVAVRDQLSASIAALDVRITSLGG
jgi:propanediol dehydratase small subunit